MKYKITPGNIFCLFVMIYSIAKGMPLPVYAIPIALLGLVIDFVLQVLFRKYMQLLLIEIVIIAVFVVMVI